MDGLKGRVRRRNSRRRVSASAIGERNPAIFGSEDRKKELKLSRVQGGVQICAGLPVGGIQSGISWRIQGFTMGRGGKTCSWGIGRTRPNVFSYLNRRSTITIRTRKGHSGGTNHTKRMDMEKRKEHCGHLD